MGPPTVTPLPSTVDAQPPTPTSSLEEALIPAIAESRAGKAGEVFNAQADGIRWDKAGDVDARRLCEMWFYAGWGLSRAEVIREIEAAIPGIPSLRARYFIRRALRALSQGGEGKSDE